MLPSLLALAVFVFLVVFVFAALVDAVDKHTLWFKEPCVFAAGGLLILYTVLVVHFTKVWVATGAILG